MDRKGLLIIILTLGVAIGWHFFYAKPKHEEEYRKWREAKEKFAAEQAKIAAANPPANGAATTATNPATPAAPAAPAVPTVPEERKTMSSEVGTVDYVFTSHGGGISRVVLKEHFVDAAKDGKSGTPVVLNEFGTFPIGAIGEQPGDPQFVNQPWTMTMDEANRTVTFERTDDLRKIKVSKKFSLPRKPDETDRRRAKLRSEYLIGLDVTYTNVGETHMMVPKRFLHLGGAAPITEGEVRLYQGFDYWRDGDNHFKDVDWFGGGGFLFWKRPPQEVFREERDLIRWGAVTNQYFTTLATVLGAEDKSEDEQRPVLATTAWAKRRTITPEEWRAATEWRPNGHKLSSNTPLHHVDGALGVPEFPVSPQQSVTRSYQVYAGPRELRRLRLLDHEESDVLNYEAFLGIIPTKWFSTGLLNTMNGIYGYITGNYALAIVILTILVKAILWPLQSKANKSMKKMAELQPQMKSLQEKYKDEPVKFQQEMGKMWKKAGVNPLSGCWPIFIQIPIFIGFYNMLGKAVELRHHGFLWVNDLAAPDTVAHIAGIPINPLPLLMAATMFLQMKMAPQGGDPMQRKIFMFMPLIFVFICYNFASALALYWTVQNIISIVQLVVNRSNQPVLAHPAPAK
jgi:YidC/Oxa1 family membrane protein insertase